MKPKLLLHICCGPDAAAVFERLHTQYEVIGFFHNPNIHPESEFRRRLQAAEQVAVAMGFALEVGAYQPENWLKLIRGLEQEPEKGWRCERCFQHNLKATAAKAREVGATHFTSTLTISPHKLSGQIIAAGQAAATEYDVIFVAQDFKKQDGFKRSLELTQPLNLYRQKYCGCRYSLRENEYA